jgi:hypothetical protein
MLQELWFMIMENPNSTAGFIMGIFSIVAWSLTIVTSVFVGIWLLQGAFKLTKVFIKAQYKVLDKSKTTNLHDIPVNNINEQHVSNTHNLGVYSTIHSTNKTVRKNNVLN